MLSLTAAASGGKNTGSITGTVYCVEGGYEYGLVQLNNSEAILYDCYVNEDGYFEFLDIPAGRYYLSFLDIGEIPIPSWQQVDVSAGETTEVSMEIRNSFSAMPCDEMLDMGWDEYMDEITTAFEQYGYEYAYISEMGQDLVSQAWGNCRFDANNELLAHMPDDLEYEIRDIRAMLETFECDFYFVMFFGGTGAGHVAARSIVGREIFIEELIGLYEDWHIPSDREMRGASEILDRVQNLHSEFNPEDFRGEQEYYIEAINALEESSTNLVDMVADLPDYAMVAVAEYLEDYTLMELY